MAGVAGAQFAPGKERTDDEGINGDIEIARRYCSEKGITGNDFRRLLDTGRKRAMKLLSNRERALHAVAERAENYHVTARQLNKLIRDNPGKP